MFKNILLAVFGCLLLGAIVGIVYLFPYVKKYNQEREEYKKYRAVFNSSMSAVKDRQPTQDSLKTRLNESTANTKKIDRDIDDIRNDLNKGKNEIYSTDKNSSTDHIRAIDSILTINRQRYPLDIH